MRQEPSDTPLAGELSPAEWRWEIPQVCDNKWHHYAVSVDSMEVSSSHIHLGMEWMAALDVGCLTITLSTVDIRDAPIIDQ